MNLERIENDFQHSEIKFKTELDGKLQFIHITEEAWDDILGGELNDTNKELVLEKFNQKLANQEFTERNDNVGVSYQAVLLTGEDF